MPSPYRSLFSPFQAHCYALQSWVFGSTQELMSENHQAVHNLPLQLAMMFFSFHFPVVRRLSVKFLLSPKQISAVTRPQCFQPFTSFSRSIFSVHSHALSPSVALPPLQSHWPILWRTVKGRRSVYCLASFLGQWDSADVCAPFFRSAQWNFVQTVRRHPCHLKKWKKCIKLKFALVNCIFVKSFSTIDL